MRAGAASWLQLVAETKPTFIWLMEGQECCLMWIGDDGHGRPRFMIDRAFQYQPDAKSPPRWVLLAAQSELNWVNEEDQVEDSNLGPITISLRDAAPELQDDGTANESYAFVKAADPNLGRVYEIGWQTEYTSNSGTMHLRYLRHLYVFQDSAGNWRFLGEGPFSGIGWGAFRMGSEERVEVRVVWRSASQGELPVRVVFHLRSAHQLFAEDDHKLLEVHQLAMLPAPPKKPGDFAFRKIGRPYVLSQPSDTLDRLVARIGIWWPIIELESTTAHEDPAKTGELFRAGLLRLNPALPRGEIPVGTQVKLFTDEEISGEGWRKAQLP